jgi:hypothetical protein
MLYLYTREISLFHKDKVNINQNISELSHRKVAIGVRSTLPRSGLHEVVAGFAGQSAKR